MPLEVSFFAPVALSIAEQREFAEAFNPPLLAAESRAAGTVRFSELDNTPVLTLGRPRLVDTLLDVHRVFPDETEIPEGTKVMVEGIVPFAQYERGLALVFALEEAMRGKAVLKGITL